MFLSASCQLAGVLVLQHTDKLLSHTRVIGIHSRKLLSYCAAFKFYIVQVSFLLACWCVGHGTVWA